MSVGHTPPMATPLRVEVLEQLGTYREAWDELVAVQPLPSPFLRSWWLDNAAAGSVRIVACFEGTRLVGGAAFELDRAGHGPVQLERVRCVGQGVLAPDHLDLVAQRQHHLEVARLVLAWLRRPGSRVIDLDGLAAGGTLAHLLGAHEVERVAAPYATIGDDSAAYLAGRPGKVRSTVSRSAKRFAREGAEVRRVPVQEMERALDDLARLHDGRWSDDSEFLDGWDRVRAAALAGAAGGEVSVHELVDHDGVVVATELDLRVGSTVAFYQAGRRTEREWRGCGSVVRARIIDAAVADGAREYDLLRGDEPYKADWATDRRELVRCVLGVGPLGAAAIAARSARQAIAARSARRAIAARSARQAIAARSAAERPTGP